MKLFFFCSGDITQKGYEKKRSRLLAPYAPKQQQGEFAKTETTMRTTPVDFPPRGTKVYASIQP